MLIFLSAAAFFYQNKWQQDSAGKLKDEILREWEERKKAEDSIKKEMEGKRRDREFIMQTNYQGQLEDAVGAKLNGVQDELAAFKSSLEASVDSRLKAYEEGFTDFNQRSGAKIKELQEYVDRQQQRQNELETSFKQHLKIDQEDKDNDSAQLKSLRQEIRELRKKLAELTKDLHRLQTQAPSVN